MKRVENLPNLGLQFSHLKLLSNETMLYALYTMFHSPNVNLTLDSGKKVGIFSVQAMKTVHAGEG